MCFGGSSSAPTPVQTPPPPQAPPPPAPVQKVEAPLPPSPTPAPETTQPEKATLRKAETGVKKRERMKTGTASLQTAPGTGLNIGGATSPE